MLNPLNVLRATISFARAVRDPDQLGEILQFVDQVFDNPRIAGPVVQAFRGTPEGARSLRERPRLGPISLDALAACPPGSLGHAFASHMRKSGLDPDAIPTRPASTDTQYAHAHLFETHDLWHVLTGFGADRPGELGLQAFYLAQFPSREAAGILTIGFANTLLFAFEEAGPRMDAIVRGWILGRRARRLLGVDWKTLWSTPLAEVRARYGIDVETADRVLALIGRSAVAHDEPAPLAVAA